MEALVFRDGSKVDPETDPICVLFHLLSCFKRFNDDTIWSPQTDSLILTCTNSSKSAFIKATLDAPFFIRYSLYKDLPRPAGYTAPHCQLKASLVLSYLRKNKLTPNVVSLVMSLKDPGHAERVMKLPKTPPQVDKEIRIIRQKWLPFDPETGKEVGQDDEAGKLDEEFAEEDEEEDKSIESHLMLQFHCIKGVVKRHRLLVEDVDEVLEPAVDEDVYGHSLRITAAHIRAILIRIRPIINDPTGYLTCRFTEEGIQWQAGGLDSVMTEMTSPAEDCLSYDAGPDNIELRFHVREFTAFIELASALDRAIDIRFNPAPAPLLLSLVANPIISQLTHLDIRVYIATSTPSEVEKIIEPPRKRQKLSHPQTETESEPDVKLNEVEQTRPSHDYLSSPQADRTAGQHGRSHEDLSHEDLSRAFTFVPAPFDIRPNLQRHVLDDASEDPTQNSHEPLFSATSRERKFHSLFDD
ncbi:hypothetical protein CALCODRAFT_481208 [Calocera cornea HHB12733]|uniref:Rad9-domain-containing protein n=1 Tax=Calocera cornea HHB12733 TaxID=1353952 RepID=A0A165HYJ2_9BASI|nr:hypothetical protein CALCODRAFT_481208 [Calocera cornea HHB12733]